MFTLSSGLWAKYRWKHIPYILCKRRHEYSHRFPLFAFQAAVSLLVCNLLDMTMLIYQLLHKNRVPRRRRPIPHNFPLRSIGSNRGTNNGKKVSASSGTVDSTLVLTSIYDDFSDSSMQSHNVSILSNIDGSTVDHSSVHITSPSPAHLDISSIGIPMASSSNTSQP